MPTKTGKTPRLHPQAITAGKDLKTRNDAMDAVQLDFFSEDPQNRHWLLSSYGEGKQNECGVYTENVMEFFEGKLTMDYVKIDLCRKGNFILYTFTYFVGNYGCGSPLSEPCEECHAHNSAQFLADCIFDSFHFSHINQDGNLTNQDKKILLNLCEKACDRIAKDVV